MISQAAECPSGRVRYVLVSPAMGRSEWLEKIQAACVEAQFQFFMGSFDAERLNGSDVIVVIDDVEQLVVEASAGVCFLNLGVQELVNHFERHHSSNSRDALVDASCFMARSLNSGVKIVGWQDVDEVSGLVFLFPDFVIQAPPRREHLSDRALERWEHGALALYDKSRAPGIGAEAEWASEIMIPDPRGLAKSQGDALDMTGPPRAMVFGSDIWLTEGVWEAVMRFEVDSEGARHHLRMDWGPFESAKEFKIVMHNAGRYEARMVTAWEAPGRSDMRLVLTEGCVSGYFTYHGATVRRVG